MRCERFTLADTPGAARALALSLRGLAPRDLALRARVAEIIGEVRDGGDARLRELARAHDGVPADTPLRVADGELARARETLPAALRDALEMAIENVAAVAAASVGVDSEVQLPQGQRVRIRELPLASAAIYVPGGRAPYPSTVVMGVTAARVAGVPRIAVFAPGGHATILGACSLCAVEEVYRAGGAHAIAAAAYGTESIERVDVIAGPGGPWVQEAKLLVCGDVGIDGYLGPSDLLVIAASGARSDDVALDLRAQAEHGEGSLVVLLSSDPGLLEAVGRELQEAPETGAVGALVAVADVDAALEVAQEFAPEHLELQGPAAEALAPRVTNAGAVFVGAGGATAFGDYVAGSNHSLPTGGSARWASGLSPRHFRRRMAEVHIGSAAEGLAASGAAIAAAEGFDEHARSMQARVRQNGQQR